SSRAALGKELRTPYSATKAALIGMTRVWALELGRHGITANACGPGPIRTELFERANPPDSPRTRAIIEGVPVKRVGTPDDVAHAVAYFLDARSGFVTGPVLYVGGGSIGIALSVVLARAGWRVRLFDPDVQRRNVALDEIGARLLDLTKFDLL